MSTKRFVAMRKDKGGDWQAVSAHATQEAAQGATGNGGMVDTEAPWYRAWRPVGTKQWTYMPDDLPVLHLVQWADGSWGLPGRCSSEQQNDASSPQSDEPAQGVPSGDGE